jgi:hypothetical protein
MVQYITFLEFSRRPVIQLGEVLYNFLIECGIPRKVVGLIIMYVNQTYSTVHIGKNLFDKFPFHNGMKQGDTLSPFLWNLPLGGSKITRKTEIVWDTSALGLC